MKRCLALLLVVLCLASCVSPRALLGPTPTPTPDPVLVYRAALLDIQVRLTLQVSEYNDWQRQYLYSVSAEAAYDKLEAERRGVEQVLGEVQDLDTPPECRPIREDYIRGLDAYGDFFRYGQRYLASGYDDAQLDLASQALRDARRYNREALDAMADLSRSHMP